MGLLTNLTNKQMEAKLMELHLGILQNRLGKFKGQMVSAQHKVDMKMEKPESYPDIDMETENLKIKDLEQKFDATDAEIEAYEDLVLSLTKL